MLRGAGWVRRAARQSWKLFASCDEFSECGRPRPQQLQRGLRFGITSTRVAVRRFCARGRAHSVWLRLCRAAEWDTPRSGETEAGDPRSTTAELRRLFSFLILHLIRFFFLARLRLGAGLRLRRRHRRELFEVNSLPVDPRSCAPPPSELRAKRRENLLQQFGAQPTVLPLFVADQRRFFPVLLEDPRLLGREFG